MDVSGNLGVKTTSASKGALDVLGNVAITGEIGYMNLQEVTMLLLNHLRLELIH